MRNYIRLMGMLFALLSPVPSFAAMTLFVSPDGDGGYIVEGDNAPGMQTVDIEIGYDKASLGNPQVEAQGGTLTNVAMDPPGMLTISVFRENPDAAFELHLKFEKKGDVPGLINYVVGTARDTTGRDHPAAADTRALSVPTTSPAEEIGSEAAVASSAETGQETNHNGGISRETIDGEPGADAVRDAAASALGSAAEREKAATAGPTSGDGEREGAGKKDSATAEEPRSPGDVMKTPLKMEKSVLQLFREYKGVKGLKEYAALFERGQHEAIVQEPAIALSDGKTPIRIKLELEPAGGYLPNFSLSDAKLVSLKKAGGKSWVITAVPSEGTWKASLMLRTAGELIELPLVVAPLVKIQDGINETNFLVALDKYLADRRMGEHDPLQPCLHEYVFTANYLANPL